MRLAGVVALALGIRILVAARVVVIPRDSVTLLELARHARDGDLAALLAHHQHPLFPALTGLLSRGGFGLESAGTAVSVVAGALAVIPLFDLARRLVGERAAWIATILFALSPYPARFAGVPLTDSLHLTLVLGGLAAGLRVLDGNRVAAWALAGGALLGAAYLTRPEGAIAAVVVLTTLAIAGRGRTRWLAPGLVALALLVTAGPYVAHLRQERGALTPTAKWKGGGEAKAEEYARITGRDRSSLPEATLETARELSVTLHPLLALLVVAGIAWRRQGRNQGGRATNLAGEVLATSRGASGRAPRPADPSRRSKLPDVSGPGRERPVAAGIALGAVTLLFLLACIRLHWLRGYLSHRHVLVPAALMLPLAGRGVLRLAERFRPGAVLVTVLVVGAILLPKTLSAQGEGKEALREMGRVVAAADAPAGPLALHGDPRVAYYAGRTALRLPGPLREVVREGGLAAAFGPELEAWLRDRGASLYVFPDQFEDVPAAGLRPLSGGAALLLPGGGPGR